MRPLSALALALLALALAGGAGADLVRQCPTPKTLRYAIQGRQGVFRYSFVSGTDDRSNQRPTGENPTIVIYPGDKLILDVNAPTHSLWIKTKPTTGTGDAVEADNNGRENALITYDVPHNLNATTLYYHCQFHTSMFGKIEVWACPEQNRTTTDTPSSTGVNMNSQDATISNVSASDVPAPAVELAPANKGILGAVVAAMVIMVGIGGVAYASNRHTEEAE